MYEAGALGQMNRCLATLVIEAVGSDCGKSAGHVGGLLVMPLLPLHGEGDHLDLLVALLLLIFVRVVVRLDWWSVFHDHHVHGTVPVPPVGLVLHVLLVGTLVHGGHPVVSLAS